MITMILVVVVHELGHLIGGLISHYRLSLFEVFGLTVFRGAEGFMLRFDRHQPLGQCLMYPDEISQNPKPLIVGGCLANLTAGVIALAAGMLNHGFELTILCIWLGGVNLIAALANILPESPTSDGGTLRDVKEGPDRAELYNRLMLVYMYLEKGSGYVGVPGEILEAPCLYDSTISAELAVYRYFKMRDMAEDNEAYADEARKMMIELARFRPQTGISEAVHGI